MLGMKGFHSTFFGIGRYANFCPTTWQEFFDAAYADHWEYEQGGAVQFHAADGTVYSQ